MQQIQSYYPDPLSDPARYLTNFERVEEIIAGKNVMGLSTDRIECVIDCNGLYLANAFPGAYGYRFSVPPAIHAIDLLYTFYPMTLTLFNGTDVTIPVPIAYAKGLQSYFISFAKHGDPNVERGPGTVQWPLFGSGRNIVDLDLTGFSVTTDDELPSDRCGFWQSAPYV